MKPIINRENKPAKVKILYFNKYKIDDIELANSWLEIDLNALSDNLDYLRSLLLNHKGAGGMSKMMAVVKADAYGHGAVEVAVKAQEKGIDYLGVATIAEGKILREAGLNLPILVLGAVFPEQLPHALVQDLETTVTSEENVINLERVAKDLIVKAKVHLKIDSGMGRVGLRPEKLEPVLKLLKKSQNIQLVGVFTHFAESENPDFKFTSQQIEVFLKAVQQIKNSGFNNFITHSANSSATLIHPESYFDMVRIGLAMYGIGDPETEQLSPVLSLKSRIINLKEVPAGNSLGYGRSFFTKRDSLIGTIPLGYADGLPRVLSNKQEVLIKGKRCLIVGNISMDQCLADLTDIGPVKLGEQVVLIGSSGNQQITAKEWAQKSYSIPYEVLCGFGNRLPRIYV